MYLIEETQIYIDIIERLRKEKKIPLLDFIEGITSERSYRRYLTHTLDIPIEILEKLMKVLDLTANDLIIYTLQVERKPSGIIELITFTYFDALEHATPYYSQLSNYQGDTPYLKALVDYFKALYVYKNTLDLKTFHASLSYLKDMDLTQCNDLESFSVYLLYHIHFNTHFDLSIHNVFLTKQFFLYQINLYNIMLDMYLEHYLTSDYFSITEYEKLVLHFYETAHKWTDAYNLYKANFHYAYLAYLKKDKAMMYKYLFIYLQHHILVSNQPLNTITKTRIENMLEIDIPTFLMHYSSQLK